MTLPSTTLLQHKSSKTSLHKSKSNGMRDRLQSADILRNTAFDCFAFHEDSKGRTKRAHMLHGIILFVYVLAFVASRLCVSFILHPLVCSQRSGVDDMHNKRRIFIHCLDDWRSPLPPGHPIRSEHTILFKTSQVRKLPKPELALSTLHSTLCGPSLSLQDLV